MIAVVLLLLTFLACGIGGLNGTDDSSENIAEETGTVERPDKSTPAPSIAETSAVASMPVDSSSADPKPLEPVQLWSDEELEAMALTLAGECYDDKTQDKRLVCEVILNRVSNADFGGTILDVLTAPNQFSRYWRQSRPVSQNDYDVAEQALKEWFDGGCQPLSDYLYFSAGSKRENEFRSEFDK